MRRTGADGRALHTPTRPQAPTRTSRRLPARPSASPRRKPSSPTSLMRSVSSSTRRCSLHGYRAPSTTAARATRAPRRSTPICPAPCRRCVAARARSARRRRVWRSMRSISPRRRTLDSRREPSLWTCGECSAQRASRGLFEHRVERAALLTRVVASAFNMLQKNRQTSPGPAAPVVHVRPPARGGGAVESRDRDQTPPGHAPRPPQVHRGSRLTLTAQ